MALIITASGPPLRLQQRLLRRGPGDFVEPGDGTKPGARRHRTKLFDAHPHPSNTAIESPSLSVTIAFFHRAVVPRVRPRVTVWRRTCMVRTSVTVTPNSFWSASRIWYLLASGCTSNAYSRRVW